MQEKLIHEHKFPKIWQIFNFKIFVLKRFCDPFLVQKCKKRLKWVHTWSWIRRMDLNLQLLVSKHHFLCQKCRKMFGFAQNKSKNIWVEIVHTYLTVHFGRNLLLLCISKRRFSGFSIFVLLRIRINLTRICDEIPENRNAETFDVNTKMSYMESIDGGCDFGW